MISRRAIISGLLAFLSPLHVAAQTTNFTPAVLDDGWAVAEPADAEFDPAALTKLIELIDAGISYQNVHAVLIEHKGRLVFEHYWPGEDWNSGRPLGRVEHGLTTLHDLRSVTKSVTSLLLGIALGDSAEEALDRPITSFFPGRDDLPKELDAVQLEHVLTMTAGLAWNETLVPYDSERNDFYQLTATDDPVGYVLTKELREKPGNYWNYNTGLTDVIGGVIENLTGKPLTEYADEVLFGPLGITDYEWNRPSAWRNGSFPSAGAGLRMRARDLAKIASVILHDGKWLGREVVSEKWVTASTTRHIQDNAWGPPNVYGYGYFWFPGTLLSGQKVIRAVGAGVQRVFVLPDAGLSITMFAADYESCCSSVDERILGRIVRAIR